MDRGPATASHGRRRMSWFFKRSDKVWSDARVISQRVPPNEYTSSPTPSPNRKQRRHLWRRERKRAGHFRLPPGVGGGSPSGGAGAASAAGTLAAGVGTSAAATQLMTTATAMTSPDPKATASADPYPI